MALLRRTTSIALILLTLAGGVCWLYADQLLNDLLRPRIAQAAAKRLGAEVAIGRLAWATTGFEIFGLSIQRTDEFLLTLPQLKAEFSLDALWQRRLDTLHISSPYVRLTPAKSRPARPKPAASLPPELPFTIDRLTISDGDLLLTLADRPIRFREVNFVGTLDQTIPFSLAALVGPDEKYPMAINGRIELAQKTTLTLARIDLEHRPLISSPFTLYFSDSGLAQGGGTLRLPHLDHRQLREILTAFNSSYPLPENIRFSLTEAEIALRLEGSAIKAGLQVAQGWLARDDMALPFAVHHLDISREAGTWLAQGDLAGPAGTAIHAFARHSNKLLNGTVKIEVPRPDRLKTELFSGMPLGLAGSLRFDVEYSLQGEHLQLNADFQGGAAELPAPYRINLAKLAGRLKLRRDDKKTGLLIDLQHAGHPLLSAAGDLRSFRFETAPLNRPRLESLFAPELLPPQLHALDDFTARGQLRHKTGQGWRGDIELAAKSAGFAAIRLENIAARGQLQTAADKLIAKNLTFNAGVSKSDAITGAISAHLSGDISAERFSVTLKKLTLEHFSYLPADGQSGLGNGRLELAGSLQGTPLMNRIELALAGRVTADEILAGEFYADLSALKSRISLAGDYFPAEQSLAARSLQIDIPTLVTADGNGRFSPEDLAFSGSLELADLAAAYGMHIGPLLSELRPLTAGLTIEGGLSIDADLRWTPTGWRASGALRPSGLHAFWKRYKLELVNGTGRIPYSLRLGRPPAPEAAPGERLGELSFTSLSLGLASLEAGSLELAAKANSFVFRAPLRLRLADGRVAIDGLSLGWNQSGPRGSAGITIDDVDLETLTRELDLPLMQGTFSGDLGQIGYADQQLSTGGTAQLEIFGGQFRLRNISYTAPFSRYPVFHADIDFSGLDLLQATRTFEFGEMHGVVDGNIRNLRLFGTTPAAFEATLATRAKGKRNISVKALQNLSIISQGGISAALSRGIYRFIDFYRYKKIGFKCSLKNDTFTLIGTARPGSDRYLVYGGLLPPRIDITTTTPTISFKEMVGRLARIERAGN